MHLPPLSGFLTPFREKPIAWSIIQSSPSNSLHMLNVERSTTSPSSTDTFNRFCSDKVASIIYHCRFLKNSQAFDPDAPPTHWKLQRPRTSYFIRSFNLRAFRLWNRLPTNVFPPPLTQKNFKFRIKSLSLPSLQVPKVHVIKISLSLTITFF